MSNLIPRKLEFLIAKAGLTAPQFVADFAKMSGVRKAVVEEWLADGRKIYDKNLEKLAGYWSKYFPAITRFDFLMPQDAFERAFGAPAGRQAGGSGLSLPIQANPLSPTQISALVGRYRLYWIGLGARPSLVGEALTIASDARSSERLVAELLSRLARGVQTFSGPVVAMGERIYLILSDVDPSSSAMRFITLQGRFDKKRNVYILGVMSGAFDRNDTISSVTVAMEKHNTTVPTTREDSWPAEVDLDKVSPELLLELTQKKLPGTS